MFVLLKIVYPHSSLLSKNQLLAKSRSRDKCREILETSEIPSAAGTQISFWRDQTDAQQQGSAAHPKDAIISSIKTSDLVQQDMPEFS